MYDIHGIMDSSDFALADVQDSIVNLLRRRRARRIRVVDGQIQFSGPWLTHSLNLLAPISSGRITIEGVDGRVRVAWKLSLLRVRIMCLLFSLVTALLPVLVGRPEVTLPAVLLGLLIAWGWLYWMNVLTTKLRFGSAVMKAATPTRKASIREASIRERRD
jgi:hypothetical protein